jgi:hypothetical protein
MKRLVNKVNIGLIIMLVSFAVMAWLVRPADLIVFLNGLLAGSMVSLGVAYWRLVRDAMLGDGEYDRGRQYGLGSFLTSVAILIGLWTSIYIRTVDLPSTTFLATSFARWVAIWGAVLKITSPDFGAGLLYGRRRKVMWISLAVGIAIALAVIWLQEKAADVI